MKVYTLLHHGNTHDVSLFREGLLETAVDNHAVIVEHDVSDGVVVADFWPLGQPPHRTPDAAHVADCGLCQQAAAIREARQKRWDAVEKDNDW